ncbi:RNA polymerase sigma-70 factor, ECF subfamily [Sphingobacterium nematocida]|uniref:RNA polymerase sigma-70 factor, ECF subfamily n=1 Tax=Sphingobacterium nematocida TaxID=1513896 RepID=A0A1T5CQJ5_9SPHI|nr:sigma-70 family RNA polymerase sigma factor [Sphingobacterium nematocida]SKB61719.1 RNA polymerase sigma-70 factor, ECF subfamily [Sphingobacterium nematocida]
MEVMNGVLEDDEFERFLLGDAKVFQKTFDFYFPIIFRYALSKGTEREDAEDITQEAFTLLFLHRDKIRSSSDLYPYLYVIAKRLCISFFRKKISGAKIVQEASLEWPAISLHLEQKIDFVELNSLLQQIITTLPRQQQEVYRRFKLDDEPQKDIAESMGVSRHTVKNHLQAASKLVRLKLQKIYSFLI